MAVKKAPVPPACARIGRWADEYRAAAAIPRGSIVKLRPEFCKGCGGWHLVRV